MQNYSELCELTLQVRAAMDMLELHAKLKLPVSDASPIPQTSHPSHGLLALARRRHLEAPLLPLLRREAGVVLPIRGDVLEVMHLVLQPHAAVGVHGADLVEMVLEVAEAADVLRLQRLDPGPDLADELVLDLVEHHLLDRVAVEPRPRRPPVPDHLDAPVRRLHVVEPDVVLAVQERRRHLGVVQRAAHVGVDGDALERVAKPQYVGVLYNTQEIIDMMS